MRLFIKSLWTEALNAYRWRGGRQNRLENLIDATIGFGKLAAAVQIPSKSLHRMLGRTEPKHSKLFAVLRDLQEREDVHLRVRTA